MNSIACSAFNYSVLFILVAAINTAQILVTISIILVDLSINLFNSNNWLCTCFADINPSESSDNSEMQFFNSLSQSSIQSSSSSITAFFSSILSCSVTTIVSDCSVICFVSISTSTQFCSISCRYYLFAYTLYSA